MLKKSLYLFSVLALLSASSYLGAVDKADAQNYAFLVREPNHLQAALLTFKQMKQKESKLSYKKGAIIVCGVKGVRALTKSAGGAKFAREAKDLEVELKACGLSLKRAKLAREKLADGLFVVENGLYEILTLKQEGYTSIEL